MKTEVSSHCYIKIKTLVSKCKGVEIRGAERLRHIPPAFPPPRAKKNLQEENGLKSAKPQT